MLLSGGAEAETFLQLLALAYSAGASGYLAGRSIWWEALTRYPDLRLVEKELRNDATHYMQRLNDLTSTAAVRWNESGPSLHRPQWNDVPSDYAGLLT